MDSTGMQKPMNQISSHHMSTLVPKYVFFSNKNHNFIVYSKPFKLKSKAERAGSSIVLAFSAIPADESKANTFNLTPALAALSEGTYN